MPPMPLRIPPMEIEEERTSMTTRDMTGSYGPSKSRVKLGLCCTCLLGVLLGASVTYIASGDEEPEAGYDQMLAYQIPPLVNTACPYYSPTWPSDGGADCPSICPDGSSSVGTAFYNVFAKGFTDRVLEAGRVVSDVDPVHVTYIEGRGETAFMNSHISFSYYCCQTAEEQEQIKEILENWDGWTPHQVSFSHVTCAIDGPNFDHVSFIIMLDEASNKLMMDWVGALEEKIQAAGVKLNAWRWQQEPYHSTLAVVNGSSYPVREALMMINERHPPGSWTPQPVELVKPCSGAFFC